MDDSLMQRHTEQPTLWVFGYGSLMWKTDFTYRSKRIGFIKGYERRFYAGNTTFRGQPDQVRVWHSDIFCFTIGQTWGVAFEVTGEEEVSNVMKNLFAREVASGGYVVMTADFYPRENHPKKTTRASLTAQSEFYLGPDDVDSMASQIVKARGSAGSNVEYVTKTADFVRMHIPEDEDSQLFQLDAKVRELV
ncbi:hypothetical protein EGW08_007166, partial [Elysia chlorotica]